MYEIKREDWISVKDRLPEHRVICIITDGHNVAMASADRTMPRCEIWWDGEGFSGYEWEWHFEPTHWTPMNAQLPNDSPPAERTEP